MAEHSTSTTAKKSKKLLGRDDAKTADEAMEWPQTALSKEFSMALQKVKKARLLLMVKSGINSRH